MNRIIIDTDPGVDDSMAILLAFNSPELVVEGITTVFGNTGTDITTENGLRLVELATGIEFEFGVRPEDALDAFNHPYAYLPSPTVDSLDLLAA